MLKLTTLNFAVNNWVLYLRKKKKPRKSYTKAPPIEVSYNKERGEFHRWWALNSLNAPLRLKPKILGWSMAITQIIRTRLEYDGPAILVGLNIYSKPSVMDLPAVQAGLRPWLRQKRATHSKLYFSSDFPAGRDLNKSQNQKQCIAWDSNPTCESHIWKLLSFKYLPVSVPFCLKLCGVWHRINVNGTPIWWRTGGVQVLSLTSPAIDPVKELP